MSRAKPPVGCKVEYMQRARARDLARAKVKVKHGEKIAEITLLGKTAFIVPDLGAKEPKLQKASVKNDGSLTNVEACTPEELEKSLAKIAVPERVPMTPAFFDSLKDIFGEYEVLF